MTLGDLIQHLLTHFSPEERELPDADNYPGRTESAIGAINAALQFLFANHASWARRGTHGALLYGPTTTTVTVTEGSTVVSFDTWAERYEGCACKIAGASVENRIRGADNETGEITLELPHDGSTGSASITIWHDSVTLPLEVADVLSPVCIKGASMLAPVPSVTQLPARLARWEEDYGMEFQITRWPSPPTVAESLGTPRRYCVEPYIQSPYAVPRSRLRLWPAPASACLLEARVRYAVPVYRLDSDPNTELPIPHSYAESVLVPVAEKHLIRSPFFINSAARQGIEDAYGNAVTMLRTLNPQTNSGRRFRSAY